MHLICPHCQNAIDLVLDQPTEPVTCPSCGSSFALFDPTRTQTYREAEIKSIGRFEMEEHLGSGRFGDVWRVRDTKLAREVALKLPRKEELQRADVELFLREARAASQLQHPNIVRVYDVGKHRDTVYIVSELIRGASLADSLGGPPHSPQKAARLCATLADALQHAHDAGVVHRDLKPANVLIDREGVPHLTDFGLAKRDGGEITITVGGKVLGTPAYMSPEQARGDAHAADGRSDVYSLGVILYELLAGKRPFAGSSRLMLIQRVLTEEPRPLRKVNPAVPRDLETICTKALEKDPARRYQSAREMGDDLRRYLDGRPIMARPIGVLERGWRWTKRNRAVAALLGLVAVSLVSLIVVASKGQAVIVEDPEARPVRILASEPDSTLLFMPVHPVDGRPMPEKAVTFQMQGNQPAQNRLRPGTYWVVAYDPSQTRFHEVWRTVPSVAAPPEGSGNAHSGWTMTADGVVDLPGITLFTSEEALGPGMVLVEGTDEFVMSRLEDFQGLVCQIADFHVAPTEVTFGEWKAVNVGSLPVGWKSVQPPPPDDNPVTDISYDVVIAFAEVTGRRLLDEAEYEFLATRGRDRIPEDVDIARLGEIGPAGTPEVDRVELPGGVVFGTCSNALELTDTQFYRYARTASEFVVTSPESRRVVRGGLVDPEVVGPPARWQDIAMLRDYVDRMDFPKDRHIGFRLARSPAPRTRPEHFARVELSR